MTKPNKKIWSNGSYEIKWINEDEVKISDIRFLDQVLKIRSCVMDGGDFESVLSALIAAHQSGISEGLRIATEAVSL